MRNFFTIFVLLVLAMMLFLSQFWPLLILIPLGIGYINERSKRKHRQYKFVGTDEDAEPCGCYVNQDPDLPTSCHRHS